MRPNRGFSMIHGSWPGLLLAVAVVAIGVVVAAALPAAAERGGRPCLRPAVTGDTQVEVGFAGRTYSVLVYVPEGMRRTRRVPLVLNLHGSQANGPIQMEVSGLRAVADDEGFIVAAPSGDIPLPAPVQPPDPNGHWAWNVPGVPTTAGQLPPPTARNDVEFLSRVIDVVSQELCTDTRRTYVTGHSGGGRMTSALGCRIADRIAAIAPNSGLRAGRPDPDDVTVPEVEDCRPARPLPVLTFHGEEDVVNPYPGNGDLRWGYAVPLAVQTWARLDDCRRGPEATTVSEHVTRFSYTRCLSRVEVQFYRVSNGGHTWPGSNGPPHGPGLVTQEIDASRIMWDFFEDFRLPPH
jgi:polyhydroxybutyrate depolymerase